MTEKSTEKVISPDFPSAESAAESTADSAAESTADSTAESGPEPEAEQFISAEDILSDNDRLKDLLEDYGGK